MKRFDGIRGVLTVLLFIALVTLNATMARAQSDHDFKGKTIRLIIGTSTGGGVDLYARLVAQFLGKHLPGEPVIIAQNMPGGSSLVAANYIYNIAKPDGLTLALCRAARFSIKFSVTTR